MENHLEKKRQLNIVVLTGAGVSTDSGIPDFRGKEGVWNKEGNPEAIITRSYFMGYPKLFWAHYKELFKEKLTMNHQPNRVHELVKELETVGKVTVLTQNIDGLHQLAGSERVIEMHGSYQTASCPKCLTAYDLNHINSHDIPRCTRVNKKGNVCNFILKPDVVLFGDTIRHWKEAEAALESADLCLILGTSLRVKPFNTLPELAKDNGARLVFINNEGTEFDELMDEIHLGHIDEGLERVLQAFKKDEERYMWK